MKEQPKSKQTRIENHYRFAEVARILRCSRPQVYNLLRGELVVHFSRPGHRGMKLVPESTLRKLLERNTRRFR
jgi:hypothetical protein